MIIGQQDGKVDSKNRAILPKKFRAELGNALVMTQGFENSLVLVSEVNFENIVAGAANMPFTVQAARHTNRYLLSSADKVELDSQGRFLIPEYLRKFAAIKEDVVFIGVGTYLEVWDKTTWGEYQKFLKENGGEIAEKLRSQ